MNHYVRYILFSAGFHIIVVLFCLCGGIFSVNTKTDTVPLTIDLSMCSFNLQEPLSTVNSLPPQPPVAEKSTVPVNSDNELTESDTVNPSIDSLFEIADDIVSDSPMEARDQTTDESFSANGKPSEVLSDHINFYLNQQFTYIRKIIASNIDYPYKARFRNQQGKLLVSFIIMKDGNVSDIKVVKSSGFNLLDDNAVITVKKSAPFPKPPCVAELKVPITYKLF